MLIKKYEAESLEGALSKVKSELGPDALILSSEQKRVGWFQKPVFVVTVAYGNKEKQKDVASNYLKDLKLKKVPSTRRYELREDVEERTSQANSTKPEAKESRRLRASMELSQTKQLKEQNFERYRDFLVKRGLQEESASEVSRRLLFEYSSDDLRDINFLREKKAQLLSQTLESLNPKIFESQKEWIFMGTPGAGKTSSIVKLALHLRAMNRRVRTSGLDHRKLYGVRELASYSKLMGIPFSGKWHSESKDDAIHLIDGPSIPFKDRAEHEEWERRSSGKNVVIVLDATGRTHETLHQIDLLRSFEPKAIIFTRLDITHQRGVIYDVLRRSKLPLLGLSFSSSFRSPFQFLDSEKLGGLILSDRGNL